MNHILTPQQQQWVERTLNGLSLEQAILQLFSVTRAQEDPGDWLKFLEQFPVGCLTARTKSAATYHQVLSQVQQEAPIPLLVVANMEHGAAEWPGHGTDRAQPARSIHRRLEACAAPRVALAFHECQRCNGRPA